MEPVAGQPLIRRVTEPLARLSTDIIIVVAAASNGDRLGLDSNHRVAADIHPGKGSLGGIFTGLTAAKERWAIVVACDMPFISPKLLDCMLSLRPGCDAVVPIFRGRPEPIHAVYSKECLPHIERLIDAGNLQISGFYNQVKVNYISDADIARFDPDYLSFFNANFQVDLDKAWGLLAVHDKPHH